VFGGFLGFLFFYGSSVLTSDCGMVKMEDGVGCVVFGVVQ
jgi:hypothetical protein